MKPSIQTKLENFVKRYAELSVLLADPKVISDQNQFRNYSKEYAQLEAPVQTYQRYQSCLKEQENIKELFEETDAELQQLAKQEAKQIEEQLEQLEKELIVILLPQDPYDDNNIFFEIRPGTSVN